MVILAIVMMIYSTKLWFFVEYPYDRGSLFVENVVTLLKYLTHIYL